MHGINQVEADADIRRREIPPEPVEAGRQLMQADAVTGGQLDDAGGGVPRGLHPPFQLIVKPEHLQKMRRQEFSRRSQLEEAVVPLGQPRAKFLFQGQKQVAGMALGAVVPFRSPGEIFGRGDVAEQPDGFHLHGTDGI